MSKDLAGENGSSLEIDEDMNISNFRNFLQDKYPLFSRMDAYSIAVNESYAEEGLTLIENDTVAIIPPVSGG